jgi:hypothetical protein
MKKALMVCQREFETGIGILNLICWYDFHLQHFIIKITKKNLGLQVPYFANVTDLADLL